MLASHRNPNYVKKVKPGTIAIIKNITIIPRRVWSGNKKIRRKNFAPDKIIIENSLN